MRVKVFCVGDEVLEGKMEVLPGRAPIFTLPIFFGNVQIFIGATKIKRILVEEPMPPSSSQAHLVGLRFIDGETMRLELNNLPAQGDGGVWGLVCVDEANCFRCWVNLTNVSEMWPLKI
jgi:hypothetical protein